MIRKEGTFFMLRAPFDAHVHLRSGRMLRSVLPCTANVFSGGVVMGNLPEPIATANDAIKYRQEILSVAPNFKAVMTIMLTKKTTSQMIKNAFRRGIRVAKLIPEGVSNNSNEGIALNRLGAYHSLLEELERHGMILSGHWEMPANDKDVISREINKEVKTIPILEGVVEKFPRLKVVVEHATTEEMIRWVMRAPANVVATLTVHHALLDFFDVCDYHGNIINPHHFCRPIAKRALTDREAVLRAMLNGNPKFFFGSDSAPHLMSAKEANPPAAGIFTAPVALPLLAEIFEKHDALGNLERFTSVFGPQFYGLPVAEDRIILRKEAWEVPDQIDGVKVFRGGEKINWKIEQSS